MIIIYEEYWSDSVAPGLGSDIGQEFDCFVWKVKLIDKS